MYDRHPICIKASTSAFRRTPPSRSLIPVEQRGPERALAVARDLQIERADTGGELPRVRAVPVSLAAIGLLVRRGVQMLGHLRIQDLIEDRPEQRRESLVALQEVLDLVVVDYRSQRWPSSVCRLGLIGLSFNLTERDGFF